MNYCFIFFLSILYSVSSFGQNSAPTNLERSKLLHQSLILSDWRLANKKDSMHYGFSAIEHDNYTLTDDSLITLDICYVSFSYKILLINSDSLILKPIDSTYKPAIKRELKELVFLKDRCTAENNQLNNKHFLSFKHKDYMVTVADSFRVNTVILDRNYQKVILKEESQIRLNDFIENNSDNDANKELFIFETKDGKFGVITRFGEVEVPPYWESIIINRKVLKVKNNRIRLITCTRADGTRIEHRYYY